MHSQTPIACHEKLMVVVGCTYEKGGEALACVLDRNYVIPIFYANMTAMQDSCTDKDRVFPCQQQLYVRRY